MSPTSLGPQSIDSYLCALGSAAPTPGGGSAACLAGSLAAALGRMVLAVAQSKEIVPERTHLMKTFDGMASEFLSLATQDEEAFALVMEAYRLSANEPDRLERREAALRSAAEVPMRTAQLAAQMLDELTRVAPHAGRSIVSDVGVAAHLALACLHSSLLNVRINIVSLRNASTRDRLSLEEARLASAGEALHAELRETVAERMARR